MGKIVATEFITLDGVIDDPGGQHGGRGGWAFQYDRGEAGNAFKCEELIAADAQLLGRVTYEGFAAAWPNMAGDEFGKKMNSMPKYVVSSTLQSADWENSTVISGDLARGDPGAARPLRGRHPDRRQRSARPRPARRRAARRAPADGLPGRARRAASGCSATLSEPHGLKLAGVQQAGDTAILTFTRP